MLNITHHQGNTNQNHGKIPGHPSEWLKLTTQEKTDIGEDKQIRESSYTAGGNANLCSHSGKQNAGPSKNQK